MSREVMLSSGYVEKGYGTKRPVFHVMHLYQLLLKSKKLLFPTGVE
jgi:hypothetical protein